MKCTTLKDLVECFNRGIDQVFISPQYYPTDFADRVYQYDVNSHGDVVYITSSSLAEALSVNATNPNLANLRYQSFRH